MAVLDHISAEHIESLANTIGSAPFVVVDANLFVEALDAVGLVCQCDGGDHTVPLWFEPTSIPKAHRIFEASKALAVVSHLSPNLEELGAMAQAAKQVLYRYSCTNRDTDTGSPPAWFADSFGATEAVSLALHELRGSLPADVLQAVEVEAALVLDAMDCAWLESSVGTLAHSRDLVVTLGPMGLLWLGARRDRDGWGASALAMEAAPIGQVVNVTGAGDTLVGATVRGPLLPVSALSLPVPMGHQMILWLDCYPAPVTMVVHVYAGRGACRRALD
jgi:hypothetical protein